MVIRYVDDDAKFGGNGTAAKPFRTLDAALSVLKLGDDIDLASGIYTGGRTIIPDSVDIVGDGAATTIISGGLHFALRVQGDDFSVTGVQFRDSQETGVQALETYGFTMRDCIVQNNQGPGVYLRGGDWYNITGNVMRYNGDTFPVPDQKGNGVGLSVMNPHAKTAGSDGRIHILVQGNAFHYNGGDYDGAEGHGAIFDFLTKYNGGLPRIANPWNYKQEILVRWNDAAFNDKSGFIVHNAEQRGWVNDDFITFYENRAWNNGQDNFPKSSDYRINNSDGVKLDKNWAYDNGAMGDDHFSFVVGSSSKIYMEGNHGESGVLFGNSEIINGGGNVFNTPVAGPEWLETGRSHWLDLLAAAAEANDTTTGVHHNDLDF